MNYFLHYKKLVPEAPFWSSDEFDVEVFSPTKHFGGEGRAFRTRLCLVEIFCGSIALFSFGVLVEKRDDQMVGSCTAIGRAFCELRGAYAIWVLHIQHSRGG